MSFGVWDEPKRSPFATYVSHDTSLGGGGGQFVKLEKKKSLFIFVQLPLVSGGRCTNKRSHARSTQAFYCMSVNFFVS